MVTLLNCPSCGAPLPSPQASSPYVTCGFCGSTSRIDGPSPAVTMEAQGSSPEPSQARLSVAFIEGLKAGGTGGADLVERVCELAERHLAGLVDPRGFANIVGNLVYDYERENDLRMRGDSMAVGRLVGAAFRAFEEIAREGQAEINQPFLFADKSGPRHYQRRVTAEIFAQLAARTPDPPGDPEPRGTPPEAGGAPVDADVEPPPKKGFFSKLFGK